MGLRLVCFACCLFALAACAGLAGTPPPDTGEQCRAWGYAPDDPDCKRLFRRYSA
jgi:hypothetical protein